MTRDGVILVGVLCALGGFVAALSLAVAFSLLRNPKSSGWSYEGQNFYASAEPAGGTPPPDAVSENWEKPR